MPVTAQVFQPGSWDGSLQGIVDYSRQDTKTAGSPPSRFESTQSQELFTLRNTGAYVLDPRLFAVTVGATFGLSQEWLETTGTGGAFREGTLWGYDLFATVLSEKPFSLNLFANRNASSFSRELAGRTEIQTETRGVTLFAKTFYIPSSLTLRQELLDEESRTADVVARRKEKRNILTYEGQRGWEDAELDLRYEFVDLADEIFPDLSYQSHEGALGYSLDFGPELNRRWESRFRAFTRSGGTFRGVAFADLTTWTVDESLRIDHTDRLRTQYRYFLFHTDTPGGAATTHTATFSLRHRLHESLTTTLGADGTIQDLPRGEKDAARARLDLAYTKRLPAGGRLTIGLGGSFQYEDDRFASTETFVPQEPYTVATPFALPIALRNPFVIESSVVATKIALGPLPIGCIPPPGPPTPLVLDQDYTLRTVGDVTEIVPIPCAGTTPGINPGDTIAVDYRFTVSRSLTFTTRTWRADVGVDYRWIRVFFSHDESEQELLSGRDGRFLNDQQSDSVGAELRYDQPRLTASVLGEARRFTSTRISYDSLRGNQFLGATILRDLRLGLSADEALIEYRDQNRQSRSVAARATLTYTFGANLFAEAIGGIRWLRDTLLLPEQTIEARLRVRWRFRKLEVNPSLGFFDRQRGDTETNEYRATLQVIRRF